MKNPEKLFLVNGVWLVCPENSLEQPESLKKLYRRQKLFVKYAKRFMMGPVLGMLFSFLFMLMQVPTLVSVGFGAVIAVAGLFLPFKYIKNAYWLLLVGLYGFLISQMIVHWGN
ncbi:MAG: hypothetical protein MUC49_04885 [Raineya sp.]|jgi:hypothetical protein|nr:hypothetical protein [Raineya sp.]